MDVKKSLYFAQFLTKKAASCVPCILVFSRKIVAHSKLQKLMTLKKKMWWHGINNVPASLVLHFSFGNCGSQKAYMTSDHTFTH